MSQPLQKVDALLGDLDLILLRNRHGLKDLQVLAVIADSHPVRIHLALEISIGVLLAVAQCL